MYYQIVEKAYDNAAYNAGSKARTDTAEVLRRLGFADAPMTPHDPGRAGAGRVGKLMGHLRAAADWKKALSHMGEGDVAVIQLPLINHTVYIERAFAAARRRGLKVIGLVHDLEELRCQLESGSGAEMSRYAREGAAQRRISDVLIVHTEQMRDYLTDELGADADSLVLLGIFDYLLDADAPVSEDDGSVAIAGNLKREKAGYIYRLPEKPDFSLYGAGLDENGTGANVHYRGRFSPDVPGMLTGSYGLVWDGPSAETCEGVYGEYLRYNAPHKTSLYLACGMPVIIWRQAALAALITGRGAGIAVDSLGEITAAIGEIDPERYAVMRRAAAELGRELRCGLRLTGAVNEALDRLGETYNN
ncbi:MAG: hypothetical protein IJS22_00590 [Lachnospiraceae bacterium]|nr:hypothetical protein [Lachnospiraceae bacterium]